VAPNSDWGDVEDVQSAATGQDDRVPPPNAMGPLGTTVMTTLIAAKKKYIYILMAAQALGVGSTTTPNCSSNPPPNVD
jgi:hypothetical protein